MPDSLEYMVHYDQDNDILWVGVECGCEGDVCPHHLQCEFVHPDPEVVITLASPTLEKEKRAVTSVALLNASRNKFWKTLFNTLGYVFQSGARLEMKEILTALIGKEKGLKKKSKRSLFQRAEPKLSAIRHKILLVDSEQERLNLNRKMFESSGFTVLSALTGGDAFLYAVDSQPDMIIADVNMADGGGIQLCSALKNDSRTTAIPVILRSGWPAESRQVQGLKTGADDFIIGDCPQDLLMAKIWAVLRRSHSAKMFGKALRSKELSLDEEARTVKCQGKPVHLTPKEFDLLTTMMRQTGKTLGKNYLLETVWGHNPADYNNPNTLRFHISSLRRKLGKVGRRIVNVPSRGYRFDF